MSAPPAEMNAEDPLFVLYTSGPTGSRGVVHTSRRVIWPMPRIPSRITFDYKMVMLFLVNSDVVGSWGPQL